MVGKRPRSPSSSTTPGGGKHARSLAHSNTDEEGVGDVNEGPPHEDPPHAITNPPHMSGLGSDSESLSDEERSFVDPDTALLQCLKRMEARQKRMEVHLSEVLGLLENSSDRLDALEEAAPRPESTPVSHHVYKQFYADVKALVACTWMEGGSVTVVVAKQCMTLVANRRSIPLTDECVVTCKTTRAEKRLDFVGVTRMYANITGMMVGLARDVVYTVLHEFAETRAVLEDDKAFLAAGVPTNLKSPKPLHMRPNQQYASKLVEIAARIFLPEADDRSDLQTALDLVTYCPPRIDAIDAITSLEEVAVLVFDKMGVHGVPLSDVAKLKLAQFALFAAWSDGFPAGRGRSPEAMAEISRVFEGMGV